MTQKEFWRLARNKRVWRINLGGLVRCESGLCPLATVVMALGQVTSAVPPVSAAARILELPWDFARRVAGAADSPRSSNRLWLLKHLGVESRPPRNPL
jgi:hypothetical protein